MIFYGPIVPEIDYSILLYSMNRLLFISSFIMELLQMLVTLISLLQEGMSV